MSNNCERGPFRDSNIHDGLYYSAIDPEGKAYRRLPAAVATALFLEKFPPTQGWGVTITSKVMDVEMRTLTQVHDDTKPMYPSVLMEATLRDANDRVIATASTVWVIDAPTAWERGETNVRGRLYQAAGLPVVRYDEEAPPRATVATTPSGHGDALDQVKAVASSLPQNRNEPTAAAAQQDPAPVASTPASTPAAAAPSESAAAASTGATEAEAPDASEQSQGSGRRGRRERLPPNAPPSPSLLTTIKSACAARGIQMPDFKTQGEAKAFFSKLNETGAAATGG